MKTKTYRAIKSFYHQHFRCNAGAQVDLTAEQAEYLLHGGFVEPFTATAPAKGENPAPAQPDEDAQASEPKPRKGGRA